MKEKVAFFLPTRKGSERVTNKNTKPFAGIAGGLVENKLIQLLRSQRIDEILFSSNDETCLLLAKKYSYDKRIKIIPRPDSLCQSTTDLQDLICYVPTITECEHILWGHVTTPLAGAEYYDKGIEVYFQKLKEGYDSLVGVSELKNFILDKTGKLINNSTCLAWPRTQDLAPLYPINHTMFLTSRDVYINQKNRVGGKPALFVMDEIHSFDIDWPEDFQIAELLYAKYGMNVQKELA